MKLLVNGEFRSVEENTTVAELIEILGLAPKAVIVELNGELVAKDTYADATLCSESKVEIIQFVGGG